MAATAYQDIKKSLRQLYLEDNRPWLVGFSGGKDSTMLASLVFDGIVSITNLNTRSDSHQDTVARSISASSLA